MSKKLGIEFLDISWISLKRCKRTNKNGNKPFINILEKWKIIRRQLCKKHHFLTATNAGAFFFQGPPPKKKYEKNSPKSKNHNFFLSPCQSEIFTKRR